MGALLGVVGKIALSLFGGGGGGQAGGTIAGQLIEKILPETQKEKDAAKIAETDADIRIQEEGIKDAESARRYNAPDMPVVQYQPGMGMIPFIMLWLLDLIDHVVDTVNHVIRPGFFIYLMLGMAGQYPLPNPGIIDPRWWRIFEIVVTFFFGGRMIVKDILPVVQYFKGKKE